MISTLYRGSVKDVLGPIMNAVVFHYTDAYSVFDWGKMPDLLPKKGEALALLAAHLFERIERAETWQEFSKTPEALALRKGNRFGSAFNELGEKLQRDGLRTHYLGVCSEEGLKAGEAFDQLPLSKLKHPVRHMVVRHVQVVKPGDAKIMGRSVPDYSGMRVAHFPRLVPLEVVFRFSCPAGSSLLDRVAKDPTYLSSRGFGDFKLGPGVQWDFPVLELFSKLETSDRPLSLSEGLAISGLTGEQLESLLFKTAWIAGYLRSVCAQSGLELADGKVEWGLGADGQVFLVDAIGPDELRILKNGVQLSKEFLRTFYRKTPWYEAVSRAKNQADASGTAEWKRLVSAGPPNLPLEYRELAAHMYLALTNNLTGRNWFPSMSLDQVVQRLGGISK